MRIFFRTESLEPGKRKVVGHPEFGTIRFISKSNSRAVKITVMPFRGVQVFVPPGFSIKEAKSLVHKKYNWIKRSLTRARQTEERSIRFFSSKLVVPDQKIRNSLVTRLDQLSNQHGFHYQKVSIRDQKSRWGSCSGYNNISLNRKLYYLPPELADYVLLHELAHTIQKNHGPEFWNILFGILGKQKTQQARRALRDYEFLFHPPPPDRSSKSRAPICLTGALRYIR